MFIGGLQKTTLIDFPGRVACTVFTVGCNFRCPFCHNKDLVDLEEYKNKGIKEIEEKEFFAFLEKRKKILDGVCITGGEPTLQKDLPKFCKKIKDFDLEVKLDTNGSNPKILRGLIEKKLVDFIAMDVKIAFEEYSKAINLKCQISNVKCSIRLILQSELEYELRTTVVPGIHDKKNLLKLAKELKQISLKVSTRGRSSFGRKRLKSLKGINYILQNFRAQNCLDPKYLKVKPFSSKQMQNILKSVKQVLPKTKFRGELN